MQVSRTVLVNTLKQVVAFIPKVKSSDSANVLHIEPLENSIKLTLAYPEASIQITVGALSNPSENKIRINGSKFLSIVAAADREIVFSSDGIFTEIRSGTSMWKEPLVNTSTPSIVHSEDKVCDVSGYSLLTAFNTVKYAIDSDSVRPALFMVDVNSGRVRACNGFQYHEVSTDKPDLSFSVPGGMVDSFCSVLRFFDGNIEFFESDECYTFKNKNTLITIKKLSAKFPDLDKLLVRPLKSDVPALLQVEKAPLVSAIKRVRLVLDDNYPYIEMHINKSEILVRGTQKSGAEAVTAVPASWASKPRVATFNVKHLLQTLVNINDDQLELRFGQDTKSKKSPMVMEGSGSWTMLNQSNLAKRA